MDCRHTELIEKLLLEVTTQRLVTRAIIAHLMANSRKSLAHIIDDLEEAVEKTSPELLPLPDVSPELQARASALARARAADMVEHLGTLMARPSPSRAKLRGRAA